MFEMKILVILCLVICIKESIGDDTCNHQTKLSYSVIFCGAYNCSEESHKVSLEQFKTCLLKISSEAKELIERGSKMKFDDCIRETGKTVCNVVNDVAKHQDKYTECLSLKKEMAPALQSCRIVHSGDGTDTLTKIVCADPTKIKCETDDSMESFKIARDCLTEKIDDMKDVKNKGDFEVCMKEAKDVLNKAFRQRRMKPFSECMDEKKDILDKNNPMEKCTGFE